MTLNGDGGSLLTYIANLVSRLYETGNSPQPQVVMTMMAGGRLQKAGGGLQIHCPAVKRIKPVVSRTRRSEPRSTGMAQVSALATS